MERLEVAQEVEQGEASQEVEQEPHVRWRIGERTCIRRRRKYGGRGAVIYMCQLCCCAAAGEAVGEGGRKASAVAECWTVPHLRQAGQLVFGQRARDCRGS